MSTVEHIVWHNVLVAMPADCSTVLVSVVGGNEPVWLGWHEAGSWHDTSSGGEVGGAVVSWADVPEGWFPGPAS